MERTFIGRESEAGILEKALQSPDPEMISVIGRRRVGKTFLIRSIYKNKIDFQITGIQNAPKKEQLDNFAFQLTKASQSDLPIATPKDWLAAFQILILYLEKKKSKRKMVVFFDELPWLATRRSGFLRALGFFWNSWAVEQNIVVVICGSAASWMIQKVVRNKGGLHNRITKRIRLYPFNLAETERFLKSRQVRMERYQIAQLYMVMGGIPHYLKEVESGKSADQNIGQICFSETGLLRDEFNSLYGALFEKPENHIAVIRALAAVWSGRQRKEIIQATSLTDGGGLSRVLEELEQSGFITSYYPFGKKTTGLTYRLTDEYSLFYLRFMEKKRIRGAETWQKLSQTQPYKIWRNYTFENLGLKHINKIKRALQIAGIYSEASSFYQQGASHKKGTQIDLLIDRNDDCINICEMKFYKEEFTLTKAYAEELRNKMKVFRDSTKTRKQLFLTLITIFGLNVNQHSVGFVDQILEIDDLF